LNVETRVESQQHHGVAIRGVKRKVTANRPPADYRASAGRQVPMIIDPARLTVTFVTAVRFVSPKHPTESRIDRIVTRVWSKQ